MAKRKKEKSLLAKLSVLLIGIATIVITLALVSSCIFYNATDAGYNIANSKSVHNLLGNFGAVSADWILGWFGLALPIFLIAPLVWGYEIIRYKTFMHPYGRIFALILGALCFSIFLNLCFGEFNTFKTGGNLGVFFSRQILSAISRIYQFTYTRWFVAFILFFIALISFNFA